MKFKIFLLIILIAGNLFAAGGRPGEIFFQGAGARSYGMGGAFIALSNDGTLPSWNPAAISELQYPELTMQYSPLLEGSVYDYLSYVSPSEKNRGFGIDLAILGVPGVERRSEFNVPGGNFTYSEMGLNLVYGQALSKKFMIGAGLSFLDRNMDTYKSSLLGLNASCLFKAGKNTRLGLKTDNIVAMHSGTDDIFPFNMRLGLSQRLLKDKLYVGVDYEPALSKWSTGFEMNVIKPIFVRFGLNDSRLTAGLGIEISSFQLDYAIGFQEITSFQRVSFSAKLGKGVNKKDVKYTELFDKAEKLYSAGLYTQALKPIREGMKFNQTDEIKARYSRLMKVIFQAKIEDIPVNDIYVSQEEENLYKLMREVIAAYINDLLVESDKDMIALIQLAPENSSVKRLEKLLIEETRVIPPELIKMNQAQECFIKGDYKGAIAVCLEVIEFDPKNELAYVKLGSSYLALGQKEKAAVTWKKALKINPKNSDLKELIKNINIILTK